MSIQVSVDRTINDIIANSVHFGEMLEEFNHFLHKYSLALERRKFGYDVYDLSGTGIGFNNLSLNITDAMRLALNQLEKRIVEKTKATP